MRTVDLFSGCGGMSLGFQNAGFEIVSAFDNWDKAVDIYRKNFTHPIFQRDLSDTCDLSDIKHFQPELIIGGPPCQDFSSAGLRRETHVAANLTIKYSEIISKIKPLFFVMENVARIEKSNAYKIALEIFKSAEYGLTPITLDASLCGVPQKRKRFFLLGELGGNDYALHPFLAGGLQKTPMSVKSYLDDTLGIQHFYRHPRSYARRGIFSINEPSPTIRGVNRPIPIGYKVHPGDSTHDLEQVRPLSTIERSYIQTFPKGFEFTGTKTDLEQMIGNAVPVKLAEYVGKALFQYR